METRLPLAANVTTTTSAPRLTPTQPTVPFAQVMGQTAALSAEAAMKVLPGGPVMAAALRSGGLQTMSAPLTGVSLGGGLPSMTSTSMAPSPALSAVTSAEGPTATAPAGTSGNGLDGALAQSQDMNLYYLQIQEKVNEENRSFTTLSNVMKAEHETVKTAIGNIR